VLGPGVTVPEGFGVVPLVGLTVVVGLGVAAVTVKVDVAVSPPAPVAVTVY
jgi:hypothetical protein